MTSANSAFAALKAQTFTTTALSRWSCLNKMLPDPETITAIHIYDFDNTLFHTPLPNTQLWAGQTIGLLSSNETLSNGGWWHDASILAATGLGAATEEPRAWSTNWNDTVVELVKLSMKQVDALTILLTGRSEEGFADLIKRMVKSKGLDFDMAGLKPKVSPDNERFPSTMHFKRQFIEAVMLTYHKASELKIYEDRPKHVKGFRDFFAEFNYRMSQPPSGPPRLATRRPQINATVVHVSENAKPLDPVVEVAEVQRMVNNHNKAVASGMHQGVKLAVKKTVFFTSYAVDLEDAKKLNVLADIPDEIKDTEIKYHGTNVLICPRLCPKAILQKIGGLGAKMTWRVIATGHVGTHVWAAQLTTVDKKAVYYTDSSVPMVVLAVRKGTRPADANKIKEWKPVPAAKQFTFESKVAHKMTLRIEEEGAGGEEGEEDEGYNVSGLKGKRKSGFMEGGEEAGRVGPGPGPGLTNEGAEGQQQYGHGYGYHGHYGHHGSHGGHDYGHGGHGGLRGRGGRGVRGRGGLRGRGRGRRYY